MKEKGLWKNIKEGAFWVAEKSTFITVPLGILFAGEAILAKEFGKAAVLGVFVATDVIMYKFFKSRREKMAGSQVHTSLREDSPTPINLASKKGSERFEHATPMALADLPKAA